MPWVQEQLRFTLQKPQTNELFRVEKEHAHMQSVARAHTHKINVTEIFKTSASIETK